VEAKKLKEVPVANQRLYKEVAERCKVSPKQVEEIVHIVGRFVSDTIKKGAFETVMIPRFGKFKVKTKKLQWANHRHVMPTLPTHIKPKE
jgi:nucleoid DNA-binding protein